jgi:hypothetical protein
MDKLTPIETKFIRFARRACCNYSEVGPMKRSAYCWLDHPEGGHTCLLATGNPCEWFEKAVLPLDKDLQAEWERLHLAKPEPGPLPASYRICRCGKSFKANSNRQSRCRACAKEQARISLRDRVRRHRAVKARL